MTRRVRLSARVRLELFHLHCGQCHICGMHIDAGQAWEVSHPIPLAAGGDDVPNNRAPAHERCHAKQTAEIDAGLIAKVRRQRQKHIGAKPRSRNPVPGGRQSKWKRKISGEVVLR